MTGRDQAIPWMLRHLEFLLPRDGPKDRVSLAKGVESFNGNKALVRQHNVERETTVALAQNHAIALVPFRFRRAIAQHVVVEHAHDLNKGHRRADMTAPATVKSAHNQSTQVLRRSSNAGVADAMRFTLLTPMGYSEVLQRPDGSDIRRPVQVAFASPQPSFPSHPP